MVAPYLSTLLLWFAHHCTYIYSCDHFTLALCTVFRITFPFDPWPAAAFKWLLIIFMRLLQVYLRVVWHIFCCCFHFWVILRFVLFFFQIVSKTSCLCNYPSPRVAFVNVASIFLLLCNHLRAADCSFSLVIAFFACDITKISSCTYRRWLAYRLLHKTFVVKFVVVTFLLRSLSAVGSHYRFCVARYYSLALWLWL